MKQLFFSCIILMIMSCSSSEYPIVYSFQGTSEIGTVFLTINENGEFQEVDYIQKIEMDKMMFKELGDQVFASGRLQSVTIESESELSLAFSSGTSSPIGNTVNYSEKDDVLLDQFGLIRDGDKISSVSCISSFVNDTPLFDLTGNFCTYTDINQSSKTIFNEQGYSFGDTLLLYLRKDIYSK